MPSLLRTIYERLLDHELGVLGAEVRALEAKNDDQALQLESISRRMELMVQRVSMKMRRMKPGDDLQQQLEEAAQQEQRRRGGRNPFDDDEFFTTRQ